VGDTLRVEAHLPIVIMDIKDKEWLIEEGQDGFSPARNSWVVENSIQRYEAQRKSRMKAYIESVRERTSAVADYLFSGTEKTVEKYFGTRTLAHLRGEDIVNRLQGNLFGNRKLFKGN